jgi:hypothetical protein
MRTTPRHRNGVVLAGLLTAFLPFYGCAGALRLHDASKAKMTVGVKDKYAQSDVLGVLDIEKRNLDNLLAEELKVVRDNHRLQVDFALLRLADDNTPMAETYTKKARNRLRELGYPDGFKMLRRARFADIDLAIEQRLLQENGELLEAMTGRTPPRCAPGVALPETMKLPDELPTMQRKAAESFYKTYRSACQEVQSKPENQPPAGLIKQAFDEWQAARDEVAKLDQSVSDARQDFIAKKEAYDRASEALERAKESGPEEQKKLKNAADSLKRDFELAKDVIGLIENKSAATERADSIIVLLAAAAGTEINTSDPNLKKAANVASEIPALAGDVRGLVEQARTPSVNNLLIELNHQIVLLEYAKRLRILSQQRVDILKTKYDALKDESRFWLRFGDAVCNYATVSANKQFPGEECDNFEVTPDGKTCKVGASSVSDDCTLNKPWNENIQRQPNNAATRELYKAMAAYLQALAVQATQNEQTFRLIDVRHQETLASRESALRAWDNLVAVPITQLDAYYEAGLKPAEIADLIIKALGFTAITVGVAQ